MQATAATIGAATDHEFLSSLTNGLSDGDGRERERARYTLVLVGSAAIPSLLERAETSDKRTRWEAAKALGAIADPTSIPTQVALLSDRESDIRWLAGLGLIRVGPRSLPAVLRALVEQPQSTELRRSAHHVFSGLGDENPVAKELLAPVMAVLSETGPASAIPPAADEVLKRIEALQRGDDPEKA